MMGASNMIVLVLKEPYLYALPVATALTGSSTTVCVEQQQAAVEQPGVAAAEFPMDLLPLPSSAASLPRTSAAYGILVDAALRIAA
jgi:hypothetical protein